MHTQIEKKNAIAHFCAVREKRLANKDPNETIYVLWAQ